LVHMIYSHFPLDIHIYISKKMEARERFKVQQKPNLSLFLAACSIKRKFGQS